MKSPKDVSSELLRIASDIDSSMEPSASTVARDIRRVIAALMGDIVMISGSHTPFEADETDEHVWTTDVTYTGTVGGTPFKVVGTVAVYVEIDVSADEDGEYVTPIVSGPEFEEASSVEIGGDAIDPVGVDALALVESKAFKAFDKEYMANLKREFEENMVPDIMSDWAEERKFAKDPYAYYGVSRRDF